MMVKPLHDEFMDADMRQVWQAMMPLPNDLRLYGSANYTAPQIAYRLGNPVAREANALTDKQLKTLQEFSRTAIASGPGP